MTSWDTVMSLVKSGRVNPLLLGLVIEEIENSIELLQDTRESLGTLSKVEDEYLRGLMLKRYLLIKRLRDYFRVKDYSDDSGIEDVVHSTPERYTRRLK